MLRLKFIKKIVWKGKVSIRWFDISWGMKDVSEIRVCKGGDCRIKGLYETIWIGTAVFADIIGGKGLKNLQTDIFETDVVKKRILV